MKIVVTQADQRSFWQRVERRGRFDCWPWLGGMGSANLAYGRMYIGGRLRPATQVSWEIANNMAFPRNKVACHSCDNPSCVNPWHVWPGTQSQNLIDCAAKGRHGSKPKTHCRRGHELTEANRQHLPHGDRCKICHLANGRERTRKYRARQAAIRNLQGEG